LLSNAAENWWGVLSFYRQASCAEADIWRTLFVPRIQFLPGADHRWLAMCKPVALEVDRTLDPAIRGPVRAPAAQIVGAAGRNAAAMCFVLLWPIIAAAAQPSGVPNVNSVTRAVQAYFASLPDYQPGDLITRSQIERVLTKLDDAGTAVPNADKIAERGLADDSFIARELSTPSGKKFMRKLARSPGTFAHLDRLSTIPRGEKLVRDLIRDKDGDKMIEYLATTKGGQKMGSMMAGVQGGTNLNQPTGRIYTVADLVAALRAEYVATRL
jgi:hypothetical protein